jgi:nitronate monooxygenase
VDVHTDALASPTGFPFKVVHWAGDPSQDQHRERVCDLGYLRVAYPMENGRLGYRCPSEPVDAFLAKGGRVEDTVGRKCLCNALVATAGFPQVRAGRHIEAGIVTAGDDLAGVGRFVPPGARDYTAADVVAALLSGVPAAC